MSDQRSDGAGAMAAMRDPAEIQGLLRDEIIALRALLADRFGEIEALIERLERTAAAEETAQARLRERHRIEKLLVHTRYALAMHGPGKSVPPLDRQIAALDDSDVFDGAWYLRTYADLRAAAVDPADHYVRAGAFEGRDPGPDFDSMAYYLANPDVAENGWPAAVHYQMYGRSEGRALRPAP